MKNYSEGYEGKNLGENKACAGEMSKEERDNAFSKLIQNEYKEQFQNRFNREFGRRFKEMKETEEELIALKEAVRPLMERYKTGNAVLAVNLILKEADGRKKVSYAERKAKAENEKKFLKKQYEDWINEASTVTESYPDFDLRKELKNPAFRAGLKSGMPIESLYRALHFDELSKSISESAARAAVENIRAGYGRINEVGTENSASVKERKNVNDLTDSEIEEILSKIRRGERISFGA